MCGRAYPLSEYEEAFSIEEEGMCIVCAKTKYNEVSNNIC